MTFYPETESGQLLITTPKKIQGISNPRPDQRLGKTHIITVKLQESVTVLTENS